MTQHLLSRRDLFTASMAGLIGPAAGAQSTPANVRIIVGFTPGASADIVARRLAHELTGKLAAAVIVENRLGAGGNIAVKAAATATPDGTTLVLNPSGVITVNPHTYRNPGWTPFVDLAPVSLLCRYELALAVGKAVPESVKTLANFTAWVRQQRQAVAYGSPGAGSSVHFVTHHFAQSQNLNMMHVPYRGAGPMVVDILGGQIAAGAGSLPALMAHANTGRLRVLASTGEERSRFFPAIPTFEEQGVRGLAMREWHGLYVSGKTDLQVVSRIASLVHVAVKGRSFIESMAKQGFEAAISTPKELDQLARIDFERWGVIVKRSGFAPES